MSNESLERAIQDRSSRLPGFYRLPLARRRAAVARWADLSVEELDLWERGLDSSRADALIENVVGTYALPVGVATNFLVNGREVLVPMAVEEPSVVAAASHGALMARRGGGFEAKADAPVMIGQVQVIDLPGDDLDAACARIEAQREAILATAHAQSRSLPALGGGALGMELRRFPETSAGPMLVLHLYYDTRDAMGANAVNTACEAIAGIVESASGGTVLMRILSNLADRRLVRAACRVPAQALARDGIDGAEVARRIVAANALAEVDPYRAATHNKGILNGIDAVALATGNDWRAIEAGAHAYAARDGQYRALTDWRVIEDAATVPAGFAAGTTELPALYGRLELPLSVGTVGGATRTHPIAQIALKILGVRGARELSEIMAAVGLAQNLAALRALVTEGIQAGHMSLHARQIAIAAGAAADQVDWLAARLISEGQIRVEKARELLAALT